MKPLFFTSKHHRYLLFIFCSALLMAIFCEEKYISAKENLPHSQKVDGENVVVEVNGIKLTQNEVDAEIKTPLESIKGTRLENNFENYKRALEKVAINQLITYTLLKQEIDKQTIPVSEDELNQALNIVKSTIPQGMTLETALKQSGTSIEEMRENTMIHVRIKKLLESQMKNDYSPSDKEINEYYTKNKRKFHFPERVHARHILVIVNENDDEKTKAEKRTRIEALRNQLLKGADFEKLARDSSEGPSKEKGGDLGTFIRGMVPKPIEDAAFSQKLNEIGPIIQTQYGYHIIQVLAHNQAEQKSLGAVKEKIREMMIQNKRKELKKKYIDGLKKKAKIVYHTTYAAN